MPKTIVVKGRELYNEQENKFYSVDETTLVLEHSLIAISKWEARFKKPFLKEGAISTPDELIFYIKCMTITPQKVDDHVYELITQEQMDEIMQYIADPMTATWFGEDKDPKKKRNKEIMTSEVIYYYMTALQIPVEFQKWHLNRLMTLIRVCSIKNEEQYGEKPKMKKGDLLKRNAALNAQRRAKLHSKG